MKEDPRDVAFLRVPPDAASPELTLRLEDLRAAAPQGIDEGLGPAGVPVELHGRAIKVAVMEEELQAAEGRLPASSGERDEMGRAEKPVAMDGAEDQKVAGRKRHGTDRRALEARPADLRVGHLGLKRSDWPANRKAAGLGAKPAVDLRLHLLPRSPVALPRPADDRRPSAACRAPDGRQGPSPERLPHPPLVQEPGVELVLPEGDEVAHLHVAAELVFQEARIGLSHPEGDEVPGIAEYALPDLVRELVKILVREDEREPVLPRLREDGGEGIGREGLELVDVEVEGGAGGVRQSGALHRRPLELREKKSAQEAGGVLADHAFREVGDHDPPPVHEEARIKAALCLAQDVPHGGVPEKPPNLVLERGDGLKPKAPLISGIFLPPEGPDDRIPELRGYALAEAVIREELRQGKDREIAVVEERGQGVPQDVFEARSPGGAPNPAKSGEDPGNHEVRLIVRHPGEEVQAHGTGEVAGVEVEDFACPIPRDRIQDLPGEVSMRIKETHTSPGVEVLEDEVPEQGALAEPRLPDDVEVLRPVLGVQ